MSSRMKKLKDLGLDVDKDKKPLYYYCRFCGVMVEEPSNRENKGLCLHCLTLYKCGHILDAPDKEVVIKMEGRTPVVYHKKDMVWR